MTIFSIRSPLTIPIALSHCNALTAMVRGAFVVPVDAGMRLRIVFTALKNDTLTMKGLKMNPMLKSSHEYFSANVVSSIGQTEIIQHTIWDTSDDGNFFVIPYFATVGKRKKTPVETNLPMPYQLPNPQAFWLESISICGNKSGLDNHLFSFYVGSKQYFEMVAAALYRMESSLFAGFPIKGIGIPCGNNFHARIARYDGKRIRKMRVNLNGYLYRPVQ